MGFKEPMRTALLQFTDNDYDGAEVRCRLNVPMSTFFMMQHIADADDGSEAERVFQEFGDDILIEWNVEDANGVPIPSTGEGFKRVSPSFAIVILQGWLEAMTAVPKGSPAPSLNGSTSAAVTGTTGAE